VSEPGFFGRWARRKAQARAAEAQPAAQEQTQAGEPVGPVEAVRPEPVETVRAELVEGRVVREAGASTSSARTGAVQARTDAGQAATGAAQAATEASPPPTLEDTRSLTPASDFRRFVAPEVDPQVKNAALKKLFTDPHFNTMDGLDVYIDDYSRPDPLPAAMLRQLASARFLKLFEEDEEKSTREAQGREAVDDQAPQSVAQSDAADPAVPPSEHHADPDLRLQQDHAPGPEGPGEKPE
jgi:hypothetical protein